MICILNMFLISFLLGISTPFSCDALSAMKKTSGFVPARPLPFPGTELICKMQATKKTKQDRNCYQPGKEADKLCLALNHQPSSG